MILTDVYIPSLDKSCDFQVDETKPVRDLIAAIAEITGNTVKSVQQYSEDEFLLCSMDQCLVFDKARSLQSYGIRNGSRLMLV